MDNFSDLFVEGPIDGPVTDAVDEEAERQRIQALNEQAYGGPDTAGPLKQEVMTEPGDEPSDVDIEQQQRVIALDIARSVKYETAEDLIKSAEAIRHYLVDGSVPVTS